MARISLNLPPQMLQKVDLDRGDVNRSRYVMRLIEKALATEREE